MKVYGVLNSINRMAVQQVYEALREERWITAERLGIYAKSCKVKSEQNRLYLEINYCQALKWQKKDKELEEYLAKFDVTSLSPIYKVALSALKSDKNEFYKNIKKAIIVDNTKEQDFVTTLGELGSCVCTQDCEMNIPAVRPNEVVDPTGAGDAYRAGLIKGLIQYRDIEQSAKMGSVCASFAVECYGTQEYYFSLKEFEDRFSLAP